MLIVFAGLPGTGKSSVSRKLARRLGVLWLRIDSIEQAIKNSGVVPGSIGDAGYRAAYAVAEDNLRLGRGVIADSVNDWSLVRDAWRDVGIRAGVRVLEVETICSNVEDHRRRIETRESEVPGLVLPTWADVTQRDYHAWNRDHLILDTAKLSLDACVEGVLAAL